MSRVAVVFTGGTISMVVDQRAGGNVPALDAAALLVGHLEILPLRAPGGRPLAPAR